MKKKEKIYIHEWLTLKPYDRETHTDLYYLRLSNEINEIILSSYESLTLLPFLSRVELNQLACFLTSYFEDLISETNIWNTFVRKHKKMFRNRELPFFKPTDYIEEEINKEDITFLIWYFQNIKHDESFRSPYNTFLKSLSEKIYNKFDEQWEFAPENTQLKSCYELDSKIDEDYYQARTLMDTLVFKSYLFYPDTGERMDKTIRSYMEDNDLTEQKYLFLNEERDHLLHKCRTKLLALSAKEWLMEYLGEEHPQHAALSEMSARVKGFFLYKGKNKKHVTLEHIATGRRFEVLSEPLNSADKLVEIDTVVYLGMVQWKGEWWFSGVQMQQAYDEKLVLKEKASMERKGDLAFLDYETKEMKGVMSKHLKAFKAFNDGSLIAFMPAHKIKQFNSDYMAFFTESLNLSPEKIEESKRRIKKLGMEEDKKDDSDRFRGNEYGLVFFNPKAGLESGWNFNSAFPLPENPYYEEEQSQESLFSLLTDPDLSTELAQYCLKHCKKNIPYLKKGVGKKYLKDMDFLLRFWKSDSYYSQSRFVIQREEA